MENRSHGPESWERCKPCSVQTFPTAMLTCLIQPQDLRVLEQELHTEIYPGTEIMTDVGTHHFLKSHGQSVLVPQPSDDEHDPLVSGDQFELWTRLPADSA